MHDYDTVVKLIFHDWRPEAVFGAVSGAAELDWVPVGLPVAYKTEERQADLLGHAPDGTLVHIELQSTNDGDMALRMARYYLDIYGRYGQIPRQAVLYMGQDPVNMTTALGPFSYKADRRSRVGRRGPARKPQHRR